MNRFLDCRRIVASSWYQALFTTRLADRQARERIKRDFESGPPEWENLQRAAGWDGIFIATCPGRTEVEGHSIADLAGQTAATRSA